MQYQVYRISSSPYQDSEFFHEEQKQLEKIEDINYIRSLNEIDSDSSLIILTNTHSKTQTFSSALLERTALMIHPNSGYDNISDDFIIKAKFPIVVGNPIRTHAVCDYVLSCLFHHFTPIPNHQHWSVNRIWKRKLLRDQNILILGHGHIGSRLNASLRTLSSNVIVHDPNLKIVDVSNIDLVREFSSIQFEDIDVIIFATSLTESSKQLINASILRKLPSEVLLINASRGEVIDELALQNFLQKNEKAFAYLDVFDPEPFTPGHMSELKNINKTSHIAGVYQKLNLDIIQFEKNIIENFVHLSHDKGAFNSLFKEIILQK